MDLHDLDRVILEKKNKNKELKVIRVLCLVKVIIRFCHWLYRERIIRRIRIKVGIWVMARNKGNNPSNQLYSVSNKKPKKTSKQTPP